eukprot:CCRYP_020423-RA/>CCRYP_020423-RA protein AED:0.77 eAED:1.00 QI:0/-1/0/1/-1/1/1/0/76
MPSKTTLTRSGTANAITRLLGGTSTLEPLSSKSKTPKTNNPIVLSKTTTPLQRLQKSYKEENTPCAKNEENVAPKT